MLETMVSPSQAVYWFLTGRTLFLLIHLLGTVCFLYIAARRLAPLLRSAPDPRFDRPGVRLLRLLKYWFGQWRHPRYPAAGWIHIVLFAGFLILVMRTVALLALGTSTNFDGHLFSGMPGRVYEIAGEYAATAVFLAVLVAAVRRLAFRPARYAVPPRFGRAHTADAIFLLGLIGLLMAAESLFEASGAAAQTRVSAESILPAPLSLTWALRAALLATPTAVLGQLYLWSYLVNVLTFYFLLCYRPFGIQFHVETSLFTIYFAKLDREALKPARWGQSEQSLEQSNSLGVKQFEDFTWKHILDFYSCADCGRCSDQCPANAVGRALSPRFLTVKARDYAFRKYPVFRSSRNGASFVGAAISEEEVWSCTTCGACEAECPLLIEYIDKIVDLRRGLVDSGKVPQSLQKPFKAIESRGNPFGKPEKKRADWARQPDFQKECPVAIVNGHRPELLYFVDSVTAFDDRVQAVARATARILNSTVENFGILGAAERDSGHDVRRYGEEILFMALRDHNSEAIRASGAGAIVTADPHAFHALTHDYRDIPPVEHISQYVARKVSSGDLELTALQDASHVYAYHDPCYLGRHNGVYEAPRAVLDSIPNLKRVEMPRCRDRSFCCGGGGLALFYEPKEEERMGVMRVRMAADAGADVIVTACPFCMINLEDAVKVAGMEGRMAVVDLAELTAAQLAAAGCAAKDSTTAKTS